MFYDTQTFSQEVTKFIPCDDVTRFDGISLLCVGEGEPLLTSCHYYVGCGNEVHNVEDKLSEISLLQQGVEVIIYYNKTQESSRPSRLGN